MESRGFHQSVQKLISNTRRRTVSGRTPFSSCLNRQFEYKNYMLFVQQLVSKLLQKHQGRLFKAELARNQNLACTRKACQPNGRTRAQFDLGRVCALKNVNRRLDLRGLQAKVRRNWHKCRATFRGEPVFLELRYFAAFGRESSKGTGGVKKFAKFRHFLAHRVV